MQRAGARNAGEPSMNEPTDSTSRPAVKDAASITWHTDDIDWTPLTGLFIQKAGYKTVVPPEFSNGAYSIELTTVGAGGSSPTHKEPWAHVFYVLSGHGEVTVEDEVQEVRAGSVSPISAGQAHSFRNIGDQALEMLVIYHPPRKRKATP
ncbi:cupin domain-containing protein [Pusillimonas noertemannii]|nr:cupin domain-containing protein [Pusillimonas noertemannii]